MLKINLKSNETQRRFKSSFVQLSALILMLSASTYLSVSGADAATATGTLGVSIKIVGGCVINSVDDITFADTDLIANPTPTANGAVHVTCTSGHSYTIGLGAGSGSGATVAERKMTIQGGGSDTISYSLYQDSGYATVWGDTTSGSPNVVGSTGTGTPQDFIVYGKIIAPGAAPVAGDYSDTVAVTVTY